MKLVHLLQLLLLCVTVFGRAIEEQIADTRVVTGDAEQLPYRFRYNVASQDSGDYKSQTESRDEAGVVTGMYRVLQPDGCVRVVHYTADAMGFHPTVTYEGDCQQPGGSINTAAVISSSDSTQPSLKDVSAPINPSSSAFLSRPVLSAVPGLINPLTTDVRDSTQEAFVSRPIQQQTLSQGSAATSSTPQKIVIAPPAPIVVATATSLSQSIPADIERLWQSLGEPSQKQKIAGIAPAITSNGNSAVKAQAQKSEEIIVESKLPEAISTLTKQPTSLGNTQTVVDVSDVPVENTQEQLVDNVPEIVPALLTGTVQTSNTVPDSILSLFDSFEPTKRISSNQEDEEIDPLEAQPSEFSQRILKDESDSSVVSAVESAPEESLPVQQTVEDETVESKTFETVESVLEVQSDEPVVPVSAPEEVLTSAAIKNEETIESKSIPQNEETKSDLDETAHEEEYSFKSVIDETIQPKNIEAVEPEAASQSDEIDSEKERSFSTLTQSALSNVKNFTAPLTQLISSSVQNLTNPVTALLNTFNKNKSTTTIAPTTVSLVTEATPVVAEPAVVTTPIPPAGKIETQGEIQDIPSGKLIVTDHHNQEEEAFTASTHDGASVSDIPAVSQHTKQTILVAEDTPAEEAQRILSKEEESLDLKEKPIVQNLDSLSIEVNDPAATVVVVEPVPSNEEILQDSAEPTIQVSDDIATVDTPVIGEEKTVSVADPVPAFVAEGIFGLDESSKVASLEETANQQVRADVRETSSLSVPVETIEEIVKESKEVIPAKDNAELHYQVTNAEQIIPETYVAIAEPVIYSHQVSSGPFYVSQPVAAISPHAYPMPVRQGTARSVDSVAATPYGLRVQKFVPAYATLGNSAGLSYVYNQHRRQGHHYQKQPIQMHHYYQQPYAARFAPAAPIRIVKKQDEAYGMRHTSVQQQTTPPTKSHYNVRPKAPKQPTWSPSFYSTYVY